MKEKESIIDLRPTELTGIIGRESMDALADIVGRSKWKIYRDQYDRASSLDLEPDFPIQIDFELNASCNLKCPMCPNSAESNGGKVKIPGSNLMISKKSWMMG